MSDKMKFEQREFAKIEYIQGQMFLITSIINSEAKDDNKDYMVRVETATNFGTVEVQLAPFSMEEADKIVLERSKKLAQGHYDKIGEMLEQL